MKQVEVAIGVLLERRAEGWRVLISRRRHDTVLPGLWEFPGGKIEGDEQPHETLVREFMEELGVTVRVGQGLALIEHHYDYAHVRLRPFYCTRLAGEPRNLAVLEHRWVSGADLAGFEFPPANAGLVRQVADALLALERLNSILSR